MNIVSRLEQFFNSIRGKHYPVIPLCVLLAFVMTGILGPFLVLHDPRQVALDRINTPPFFQKGGSIAFPLGTDQLGRDIFSRALLGARASLVVAVAAILLAGALGVTAGVLAGYLGRPLDDILMRLTDSQLSIPIILLAIIVIGIFGASFPTIVVVIAITAWPRYARLVRSETINVKEEDFVAFAKVAGGSNVRIMRKHILPNVLPSVIVLVTLEIPRVILLEAALSFLGLGIQPPTPSWGGMIAEGRAYLSSAWWLTTFPGIALLVTSLSANITGDWLRDALDPSLQF